MQDYFSWTQKRTLSATFKVTKSFKYFPDINIYQTKTLYAKNKKQWSPSYSPITNAQLWIPYSTLLFEPIFVNNPEAAVQRRS